VVEGGETAVTEFENPPGSEPEKFPLEPRYHPVNRVARIIYDSLASPKLAMTLLIVILACCLAGVTLVRGAEAGQLIFGALWFNGLLVLLIVNVACCFFGRIWHRRLTWISFGMILFHLSFVAVFSGIIYNSLFYFRGTIRLTEGETLRNNDPQSYDVVDKGRFFNFSKMKGETTLEKMHAGYKVEEIDKRVAYEITVGEGSSKKKEIIYVTKYLDYQNFRYFRDKEGYSILTLLHDKQGNMLYGAFIPLQSFKQKDGGYHYASGTKDSPESFPFPVNQLQPLLSLQLAYSPSKLKERAGNVEFRVWPLKADGMPDETHGTVGTAAVGGTFNAGDYDVSVSEVRYWAAMAVRYEPGQPVVLTSLWVGLAGMIITTFARMRKRKAVENDDGKS